ncbi:scavenger receptor class F member 1-like, partial [Haliotis rubra]|uniref:scavenger receptor class F member 1-like n=1 Tax=Haliotis rubra TaxID=36100 RepID=UPI001EE56616
MAPTVTEGKVTQDEMTLIMSTVTLLLQLLCSVSGIRGASHCLWPSVSNPCPACEIGWYGDVCNFNCSFCDSGGCHRDTGICKQCRAGYFSHTCNVTCPPNCRYSHGDKPHCSREAGHCLENCQDGWWGDWCERKCSGGCEDNSCYFWDGSCARGCRDGWAGDSCDTRCPGGCHGDTCERYGSHKCTQGCTPGVHGHHCDKQCNRHCRHQDCFYDHGMKSTVCRQGCVDGWMSLDCKMKCPGNCEACSQETGECTRCKPGYWGSDCT